MTDPWDEKPKAVMSMDTPSGELRYYSEGVMDARLEKAKVEYDLLKEHSGRWLHFVAVDYPEINEPLSPQSLMELKEKAAKWDQFFEKPEARVRAVEILLENTKKLEAIRKWAVKHRFAFIKDVENELNEILEGEA